jgi:acyl-CoA reductase-like NAD-dependent aldehyde dehydrogenase
VRGCWPATSATAPVRAHGDRPRATRDDRGARGDLRPGVAGHHLRHVDEAIAISNGTAYGLSSAVCTNRLDDITRFVNELQVGTVNVREVPGYRLELTPFGGIKDSGLGYKEGVQEAIKSFTNTEDLFTCRG